MKFTEKTVARTAPPSNGADRAFYWCDDLRGFGLVVYGPRHDGASPIPAFVLQRQGDRVTIGRMPPWTLDAARAEVHRRIVAEDQKVRLAPTLAEALDLYRRNLLKGGASPRTAEAYEGADLFVAHARRGGREPEDRELGEVARHLRELLDRRIHEIDPTEVREIHERLSEKSKPARVRGRAAGPGRLVIRGGPYLANRVMRGLRAAWNGAAREYRLPREKNPVVGLKFNKERRRQEPIADLLAWRARVEALSPVRRDLYLALLLTGLRSSECRGIRKEHVDLERGTIHIPRPKGGEDRAYTVPLSRPALDVLRRRFEDMPDSPWAFPSVNNAGEVVPVVSPQEPGLPSPHRCRDTFITAATRPACPSR